MFTKGGLSRLGFAFAVFFSAILIAASPAFGQAEFREPVNDERNPGRGLRVLQVDAGGTAARLRLQPMDMLTRYGKFEIIDHSSYFKAREAGLNVRRSQAYKTEQQNEFTTRLMTIVDAFLFVGWTT